MSTQQQNVGLGAEDLKGILSTVIQEARKPLPPTPEEEAKKALAKEMRAQAGRVENEKRARVRQQQHACTHRHSAKEHNAPYGVLVKTGNVQYIFCQFCRAKIRQGEAPEGVKDTFIYDTALFNRMLQEL